ncbi:MAG: hypothetical protein EOP34_04710 [Rickettsiales bacterium]|nr:MAG: hypothetical protein EOP34_04710 [Rickettsiales bacterium]
MQSSIQSPLEAEIEAFTSSGDSKPDVKGSTNLAGRDPKIIYKLSSDLIDDVKNDRDALINKINSEVQSNNISQEKGDVMKENVNTGAETIMEEIKETNNVAVDNIDDSSDTEDYIFKK